MKRFIDIRNQGTGSRFAFWDTITDSFENNCGSQAWDNWVDFEEDFRLQMDALLSNYDIDKELERYRGLCPDWVNDGKEDDVEKFYAG